MNAHVETAGRAANESAAFFDLPDWTILRLTGRDAVSFLHNFCTADVKGLKPGTACEAFVTNVKARVVGHVFVMNVSEYDDEGTATPNLLLFGSPGQNEKLAAHLDRYLIREDVTIEDLTVGLTAMSVCGPNSLSVVYDAAGQFVPEFLGAMIRPAAIFVGEITSFVIGTFRPLVTRLGTLGDTGLFILNDVQLRDTFDKALTTAGAVPGSPDLLESLRIEACFPYYGVDITEDHLAPEVGRPWAVSYTKGCYLGQEPIARIDALGHVNKLLRGVRLESGPVPERGAAIIADGKEIGSVTSATTSVADGKPIALAYLRSKFSEPGTNIVVRTHGGDMPATVFGPRGL